MKPWSSAARREIRSRSVERSPAPARAPGNPWRPVARATKSTAAPWSAVQPQGHAPWNPWRRVGRATKSTAAPWSAVQLQRAFHGIHGARRGAPRNPRPLHGARSSPGARATESMAPGGARHEIHGRSMERSPAPRARPMESMAPGGARHEIHGRSMARGPAPARVPWNPWRPAGRATKSTAAPWSAVQPRGARHGIHGAGWGAPRNPRPLHGARSSSSARSMESMAPGGARHEIHGRSMERGPAPGRAPRNPWRRVGRATKSTAAPWSAVQLQRAFHGIHGARRGAPRNPRPLHGARPGPRARSTDPWRPAGRATRSTAAPWRAARPQGAFHGIHGARRGASMSRNRATKGCSGR